MNLIETSVLVDGKWLLEVPSVGEILRVTTRFDNIDITDLVTLATNEETILESGDGQVSALKNGEVELTVQWKSCTASFLL